MRIGASLIWNFNRAISRGHLGAFRIPDDLANHVSAGFHIETGFNGKAGPN